MGVFGEALKAARLTYVEGHLPCVGEEDCTDLIEISGIKTQTDLAVLLVTEQGEAWVPKSQLVYADSEEGVAEVSSWFTNKEGLL